MFKSFDAEEESARRAIKTPEVFIDVKSSSKTTFWKSAEPIGWFFAFEDCIYTSSTDFTTDMLDMFPDNNASSLSLQHSLARFVRFFNN